MMDDKEWLTGKRLSGAWSLFFEDNGSCGIACDSLVASRCLRSISHVRHETPHINPLVTTQR